MKSPLRKCRVCGVSAYIERDLKLFGKHKKCKHGRNSICKKCNTKRQKKYREENPEKAREYYKVHRKKRNEYRRKYRYNNPFRFILFNVKGRAKRKGLNFDLTLEYLLQLWGECDGICPMTGMKMLLFGKRNNPFTMSVDRIEPEKGYVKRNVRFVSLWYNVSRSNYGDKFTLEMCQRVVDRAGTARIYACVGQNPTPPTEVEQVYPIKQEASLLVGT